MLVLREEVPGGEHTLALKIQFLLVIFIFQKLEVNVFHECRLGKSKTKTGCKFTRVSVIEATTKGDVGNCKTDKCRDKDPTVKAVGLHWDLPVLHGDESPARCVRMHFSFSHEVLVLDEMKDVIETELWVWTLPRGIAELLSLIHI